MQPTRRYWTTVGLAGLLFLWAASLERPMFLLGGGAILSWLLVHQYRFARTVTKTVDEIQIEQQLDRTRVVTDETTMGLLSVQLSDPSALGIKVETAPPIGSDTATTACKLTRGEHRTQKAFEVTWPVAGSFDFHPPIVTMSDTVGLFSQTLTAGTTPTVTVEPRAPAEIHVGEGGDRVATGFGEHNAGTTGSGLTPADIRKYIPGDSIRQIDWKATARLDEPHVRKFEAKTDFETALFVDHRATMATGRSGERKLDFGRQIALALVSNARKLGDPLACYMIGDQGTTSKFDMQTVESHYDQIEQYLRRLEPTSGATNQDQQDVFDPAQARQAAEGLTDDSAFASKLRPFFNTPLSYVQRVHDRPLFASVRNSEKRLDGPIRTVIVTDDTNQTELLEAVKIARSGNRQVTIFLTPSVLYERPTISTLDEAYQQYADFEQFRRRLASLSRVEAFEVGPQDRLTAILNAGQDQRRASQ